METLRIIAASFLQKTGHSKLARGFAKGAPCGSALCESPARLALVHKGGDCLQDTKTCPGAGRAARLFRALLLLAAAVMVVLSLAPAAQAAEEQDASTRYVVPLGKAVGIKLFADGVLVVSVSPVQGTEETRSPAKECGLKEGDILLTFNGEKIRSTEHLQAMLAENGETAAELTVQRDGKTLEVTASPVVCEDGGIRLGAWIRDSMAGVGTLTYYDPATGSYGALGHGITDVDTAELMPLASGSIMETMVKAVKKGQRGDPGELKGDFTVQRDVGTVTVNSNEGIFGTVEDAGFISGEAVSVAEPEEVHAGEASILCTISGSDTRAYEVEILRVNPRSRDGRDLLLRVTDPELLETTGGIVQGMSGSPILQDGRLVGAVTHVLVANPAEGYGIFLENMLTTAG